MLLASFFLGDPSFSLRRGKGEEIFMVNLFRLVSDILTAFLIAQNEV